MQQEPMRSSSLPQLQPKHLQAVAALQRLRWVAVVVILVTTIMLSMAIIGRTQNYLVRQNEEYARQLAFHLNTVLYSEFVDVLSLPPTSSPAGNDSLDAAVRHLLNGLEVTRLAIYDTDGRQVFSTRVDYTSDSRPADHTGALTVALTGQPSSTFLYVRFADGRQSEHILASYVPIYATESDAVIGAFAIEQDLSVILAQLQQEQLIIAAVVVLLMATLLATLLTAQQWAGNIIAAQHAQLREHNQALLDLQQVRDDLTRLIVHDLRSPLTAIIGYLDLLKAIDTNPEHHTILNPVIGSARQMNHLISTIIDVQRLQNASMPLDRQPITLRRLLQASAEEYTGWAQRDGKTIVVDNTAALSELHADPDLLQRLIGNLLSNALKHTSEGTIIRLMAQSNATEVTLSVSDNGPGIPTELLPKLFSRYVRGSGHKEGGSSGLGLAFVRLAAEAHGGAVRVTSTPGIGTIFSVVLPVYANTQSPAADTQPPVDSQFNTVTTIQPLPTQT